MFHRYADSKDMLDIGKGFKLVCDLWVHDTKTLVREKDAITGKSKLLEKEYVYDSETFNHKWMWILEQIRSLGLYEHFLDFFTHLDIIHIKNKVDAWKYAVSKYDFIKNAVESSDWDLISDLAHNLDTYIVLDTIDVSLDDYSEDEDIVIKTSKALNVWNLAVSEFGRTVINR